jgi:hypothetical protein
MPAVECEESRVIEDAIRQVVRDAVRGVHAELDLTPAADPETELARFRDPHTPYLVDHSEFDAYALLRADPTHDEAMFETEAALEVRFAGVYERTRGSVMVFGSA